MTSPPDWATNVTPAGIHNAPAATAQYQQMSEDQVKVLRQKLRASLLQTIVQLLTGLFVPHGHIDDAEHQIIHWVEGIPILGDIVEAITGIPDGNDHDLGTWANNLLHRHQPVPKMTSGGVGDEHPNLLLAPDFRATGTLIASQNWTWTNSVGFDSLGAAKVIPAGYITELLSNEIPVTAGQTVLSLSIRVKADSLVYTGTNPITMGITRYKDRAEVGSDDLMMLASPAGTFDWTELFMDQYQVPADCDEVRMRLTVGANATAGNVYWDEASVQAVGMGLIDRIVSGLENINTPGWNYVDLLLSMFNQFRTTTDHAARITYLESLQSAGNKINDEFLRTASNLGPNWHQTYSGGGAGVWQTDGDYAFLNKSGFGDRAVLCRYIGSPAVTSTDTQKIIAVLGSKGQDNSLLGLHSHIDLYGRMDTAETNWIRARFSSNGGVSLTRNLGGVITDLATITVDPVSAGATLILYCGTDDGIRFFRIEINGVAILGGPAAPISDSTSNYGASYRGYGHGAKWQGSLLILGQLSPPSLNAWAAQDD